MEWTGFQQIFFFWESFCLGLVQGVVFDVFTGFGRYATRRARWISDAVLGLIFALLLFFGALVIMDGQLHPLLFFGSLIGVIAEHVGMGKWLTKWIARLCYIVRKGVNADFGAKISIKTSKNIK